MSNTELVEQLNEADIEYDQHLLTELTSLVDELNLGAEDLVNEWLSYQYNNKDNKIDTSSINQLSIKSFSKCLRYSKSAKIYKKTRSRSRSNNNNMNTIHSKQTLSALMEHRSTPNANANNLKKTNMDNQIDTFLSMTTPSKSSVMNKNNKNNKNNKRMDVDDEDRSIPFVNIMQSPAPINDSYKSRKKRGEIIDVLHDNLAQNNNIKRVHIEYDDDDDINDRKLHRFMYEDIHNKQDTIKERISYIGKYLMESIKNDIDNTDNKEDEIIYSAVDEPSQRMCYFLGRIMNDGDNSGSDKITNGNIILESDWNTSYGKRVKLDISSLKSVSLFPGQIVAIKGINSCGKQINVNKIYQNADIHDIDIDDIDNNNNNNNDGVLQIMIGCGPFTSKQSLQFIGSPLYDFGKIVISKKPNIIILMGPFTDCENISIIKNEINCTFNKLFEHLLTSFINFINNDGFNGKIIIIPSTKDVHHFSAFPQEKYNNFLNNKNVYFFPNPSQFKINNVSFGLCSADFLMNCCKIGLTKNIHDRLLSMMSHCINQQNFYPLQPSISSLRMDYNKYKYLYIKKKLNIFIMPSKLLQFVKIYKNTNTICINPSFLTKSYGILNIHQSNNKNIKDYTKFIRVDIKRI